MRASRTEGFTVFAAGRAGRLFRSACLLTSGDVHLAEDLVQETLSRMYVLWGRARRIDNPAAYAQTADTMRPDGMRVVVSAFNSGDQSSPATRPAPAVTMDRLTALATSPEWPKLQQR